MTQSTRPGKRFARGVACSVAGAGIASAIAVGGVATAAPATPAPHSSVPGTHCSVSQVEGALAKQDPALWKRIDGNPKMKKHFESAMTMTKEQKQAKRAEFRKNHPTRASIRQFMQDHHIMPPMRTEMKKNHDAIKKAKATCEQF
ncbi:hemophore-related protein [Gordonia sp. SL306]|uniref:hemophore-related protein n=1 Tax=Gordonia sp. SL306 TaxID=2995145 RepID=UPI002270B916|nr:hemophore-related protein [Gordonia sp. SL306]WAC57400.1 hemophore-related protein [Gordonia sp. SL306]